MEIARVEANYKVEQKQREIQYLKRSNQLQQNLTFATTGGLLLFLVFSVIVFIAYRGKTKVNRKLQATQQQLVVQEKLASLGQLTAGIAHEIQNPLNFVNNFADLTAELAREAREHVLADDGTDLREREQQLRDMLHDIEHNADKVCRHGERASAIVRDMVAHAQPGSGEKQFTDINTLLTETISIAYQGKYAHTAGLDVSIERDFTPGLPSALVYVPDIRRVFINIFNNAFDALDDRRRTSGPDFNPAIKVSTTLNKHGLAITIRDNGPGIPADVRGKIFQPFFTTKDPGRGTGLGLHMSYDIVTVKHGGELLVKSEVGEYTEFTILLPLS
jgi:signal transduction histidine kinase